MKPAFSVIFLTPLIGAGQGVFLAAFAAELFASAPTGAEAGLRAFLVAASAVAVVLSLLGLAASFFHLGHPERSWRAAACWRTSWLSREVIVLPAFIAAAAAWGLAHLAGSSAAPWLGGLAALLAVALYVCTGMIYAAVRVIQEWASPLTVVNYVLLGIASGLTLATVLAAFFAPALAAGYALAAIAATLAALALRAAALVRNARLRRLTSLQSAIGIKHPRIVQKAQGAMGGSFNTREFFHGAGMDVFCAVLRGFLVLAFLLPAALLAAGWATGSVVAFALAFAVQFTGLLMERWFFFAQASHPQNLYYQSIA